MLLWRANVFSLAKSVIRKTMPWVVKIQTNKCVYWEKRAKQFGKHAVLNLAHPEEDFDQITENQKNILLPILIDNLDGSECSILDFGCGPGRFTSALANAIGCHAIGIDVSKELVSIAPSSKNVTYIAMPDGRIPLEMKFDVVWVCLVLGGIPKKMILEVAEMVMRAIKPGGLLFLVENTSDKPSGNYWFFRTASQYQALFPSVTLKLITTYSDLGEEISVLVGRKHAC